ncbi:MAG: ATP-binding protein [Desulfurococcales archaeon]|nr:ATP-binding protein [Desulfurococcales archaeon]
MVLAVYLYPFSIYIVGSAIDTIWVREMPGEDIETSRAEKKVGVDEIISRMHSYDIYAVGVGRYRFVDRDDEIRKILRGSENLFLGGRITVLYGPKGCGKSTLFRILSGAADQAGSGLDVLVVERSEEALQKALLYLPKSFRGLGESIAGYLRDSQISPDRATIVSTSTIFGIAFTLASYIASRLRRGRGVLIVLDEVKADSPEHLSNFRQWLESFANDIAEYNRIYSEKGGSIAVIALVSDAAVEDLIDVVGDKVDWALIWNLSKEASKELAEKIGLDIDPEILWRLTGGNSRSIITMKRSGLEKWLWTRIVRTLTKIYDASRKTFGNNIWDEFREAVNDLDNADHDLKKIMLRNNIIIYTAGADPISHISKEPWIGRDYAYQIPAYYYALKTMARKRSTDISPEEVIKEAMA